jgi:hypothetical protein
MDYSRQIRAPIPFYVHLATKSKDHSINFADIASTFTESLADKFKKIPQGSAVLWFGTEYYACIWIGRNNVSLMLNKEEINGFMFLIEQGQIKEE